MKCKEHPQYAAVRKPVKTQKYPDGCPVCWKIWESVQNDPKRYAPTVNVELQAEEARVLALMLARSKDPILQRLHIILVAALRSR